MKKILQTAIIIVIVGTISILNAQPFSEFTTNLKNGKFNVIYSLLAKNVEVSILKEEAYIKTEAEKLLQSFFNGSSNNQYKVVHSGTATSDSFYEIGELKMDGNTYRTYLYSKNVDGVLKVQEFRIER